MRRTDKYASSFGTDCNVTDSAGTTTVVIMNSGGEGTKGDCPDAAVTTGRNVTNLSVDR